MSRDTSPASALVGSQPRQDSRRRFGSTRRKRIRQVVKLNSGWLDVTARSETFQRATPGKRCQKRYRTSPVGDLDGLTTLHKAKQITGSLT